VQAGQVTAKNIVEKLQSPLEDYPTAMAIFEITNGGTKLQKDLQRSKLDALRDKKRWIEIAVIYAKKDSIPAKLITPEYYASISENCNKAQDTIKAELMALIALAIRDDFADTHNAIINNIAEHFFTIVMVNASKEDIATKLKKIAAAYISIENNKWHIAPIITTEIGEHIANPMAIIQKATKHFSAHKNIQKFMQCIATQTTATPLNHESIANAWRSLQKQRNIYHTLCQLFIPQTANNPKALELINQVNINIRAYNETSAKLTDCQSEKQHAALHSELHAIDQIFIAIIKQLATNAGYEFNATADGTITLAKINATNNIPLYIVNDLTSLEKYIATEKLSTSDIIHLFGIYFQQKNLVNIPQIAFAFILSLTNQHPDAETYYEQMVYHEIARSQNTAVLHELLCDLFKISISNKNIYTIVELYLLAKSIKDNINLDITPPGEMIINLASSQTEDSDESRLFVLELIGLLHMHTNRKLQKITQYESNEEIINNLIKNGHYIALMTIIKSLSIIPAAQIQAIDPRSINKNNKAVIKQFQHEFLSVKAEVDNFLADDCEGKTPEEMQAIMAKIAELESIFTTATSEGFPDKNRDNMEIMAAYGVMYQKIISHLPHIQASIKHAASIGSGRLDKQKPLETGTRETAADLTPTQKRNKLLSEQQTLDPKQRMPHTIDDLIAALKDHTMLQEITDAIYTQVILFLQKNTEDNLEIQVGIAQLKAAEQINTLDVICLLDQAYPGDIKLRKLFVKICRTTNPDNIAQEIQSLSDTENKTVEQEEKLATLKKFEKLFLPTTSEIYKCITLLSAGTDIPSTKQRKYLKVNATIDLERHKAWMFSQTAQILSEQLELLEYNATAEAADMEHILWIVLAEKNKHDKEELIAVINEILFIEPTNFDLAIATALVFDAEATALLSMLDTMNKKAINFALQKWKELSTQINAIIDNVLQNKLACKQKYLESIDQAKTAYIEMKTKFDAAKDAQSDALKQCEEDIGNLARILNSNKKLNFARPQITIAEPYWVAQATEDAEPAPAPSKPKNIKNKAKLIRSLNNEVAQLNTVHSLILAKVVLLESQIATYNTDCEAYMKYLCGLKTKITDSHVSTNTKSKLCQRHAEVSEQNASLATENKTQQLEMEKLTKSYQKLQAQMETMTAANQALHQQINTTATANQTLQAQMKTIAAANQDLQQQIDAQAIETDAKQKQIAKLKKDIKELKDRHIKSKYFLMWKLHTEQSKHCQEKQDSNPQAAPHAAFFQPTEHRELIEYKNLKQNICQWFKEITDIILEDKKTSTEKTVSEYLNIFRMRLLDKTKKYSVSLPRYYYDELKDSEARMKRFAESLLSIMTTMMNYLRLVHPDNYSCAHDIFAAEEDALANLSKTLAENLYDSTKQITAATATAIVAGNP
jgi:hypothetical protein